MTQQEQHDVAEAAVTDPGLQLRAMRERQGLEISEVARRLRLPTRTIEQLESGQFERIGPTYRRGYLANYARLLGLEPDPLLNLLDPVESAPLRPVLPVRKSGQRWGTALNFATYALVSGVIVAPLVYFFVLGGARLFESELSGVVRDGTDAAAAELPVAGYRERIADVLSLNTAQDAEHDGLHLSASALPLTAMRPSEPVARVEPSPASTAPASTAPTIVQPDPLATLRLELSADSWVEIEDARGERLEFDLLRGGAAREYAGRAPFSLLLGRASGVSIELDGEPVAFVGQDRRGVTETIVGLAAPNPDSDSDSGSRTDAGTEPEVDDAHQPLDQDGSSRRR